MALGLLIVVVVGLFAANWLDRRSQADIWHDDYNAVSDAFNAKFNATTPGNASSVPPKWPSCHRVDDHLWKCAQRWAPPGRPHLAEAFLADVSVTDGQIIVGGFTRIPDPDDTTIVDRSE
ncbi:hypothetical protein CFH99_18960 [Nocardioides aromaticivorans]|uniref:Uncharacterized protein n=1 Tax=Nocardioides aromaticivorans TaxID=200618 RepID=A0ABX7PNY6_9ACTN|nr:hypothetical protein CFH99_18960 [Nocardioides aromaticivorans]